MADESSMLADLAAEAEASPVAEDGDRLERIEKMAGRVCRIDEVLEEAQASLKKLTDERNRILGREMVDLMDEAHVEEVQVNGRKFTASPYYHASIKSGGENEQEAYDWLESHEAGDLIKRQVIVAFPDDCGDEARELQRYITERYQMATAEMKRGVPWNRLTSWVKEQVESSVAVPLELLGATVGRVVKVKEPRKK